MTTAMGRKIGDAPEEPYAEMMEREQRKLAEIGGRPCEWDTNQWAKWNAKSDDVE